MKISGYDPNTSPQLADYLIGNQASGPTTKKFLLSDVVTLMLNNIPAAEGGFGFVSSGLVWSGDAYASTRAASMTAGRVRVNTSFLSISAVTARVFTASRDTYVDVLDNLDGTGTLVYTEVTNNAASPALASNSIRIAIIVTGASTIASVASINQGQFDKILPIASSQPYQVTDSLGNLIAPRDPNRDLLGYRQIIASSASVTSSAADIAGLPVPFIMPDNGRKLKMKFFAPQFVGDSNLRVNVSIQESTTLLNTIYSFGNTTGFFGTVDARTTVASGSHTFKVRASTTTGTFTIFSDTTTAQAFLEVRQG